MKKTALLLSSIAICALALSCNEAPKQDTAAAVTTEAAGSIVYFNLDTVLEKYDMANDLRSTVETKVQTISQDVQRRQNKLEKDIKSFQDKINKGLLISSVAQKQQEDLQKQQVEFQNYAAQKQQEIAEEQQVMMNQIADAIKTFIDAYNAEKGYALIITTQGDILPAPVVAGDESLDITEDLLAGLNAEYVKTKSAQK